MRNILGGVFLFASFCAFAQTPSTSKATLQQMLEIEKKIALANNECDYDYFRRIEAEEFIFTDSVGRVITRAEDLAGEKDCKRTDYKHEFDEPRFLKYPAVVVFNARHTISGQRNGKDFRVSTRFTDVFVWREGRWQLVAGHASRVPAKE